MKYHEVLSLRPPAPLCLDVRDQKTVTPVAVRDQMAGGACDTMHQKKMQK